MVNTTAVRNLTTANINDNGVGEISAADVRGVFFATFNALDSSAPTDGITVDGKGQIAWTITALSNRTYTVDLAAPFAYNIDTLVTQTTAGTCTVSVQISGINVTGLNAVAASTTLTITTATAARSVAPNAKVTLVVSAVTGATEMAFALRYTKI